MKTYTTVTAKGNELRFEISYNKEVVEVERNLDGYIVTANEIRETEEIKVYVNGQYIGKDDYLFVNTVKNSGYEEMVPAEYTHYLNINGKVLGLTSEQAAELNKIFAEVKEEGKSEKVKEIEKEEIEEKIETAKAIVEKAEQQRDIPSYKEARLREKSYNNLHNEGGEGYVPHIVDIDEYNRAKSVLAGLRLS